MNQLFGQSVYLRAIQIEDAVQVYETFNNEEALYMTGTRKRFSLEKVQEALQQFLEDETRYDCAICSADTDEMIGDLSITEIDPDNHKAMFRIALHHQRHYGKGFGTEATLLAQQFVFEKLKLNRLELQVLSHNPRGIKSYEKSGFKKEGTLRQAFYMNNEYSDEIIMSVLKDEYLKIKKKYPALFR